ncbi:MAG: hypothetical protein HKN17_06865 [Rhodothermales bacterium]|nr:hypothetical protein [Rhodothermales bacterium]
MLRPTHASPLSPNVRAFWNVARFTALVVTAAVLAGLVFAPDLTLRMAWFGIVPILPASFLVNAGLWRSVCPIATANMATGITIGKRPMRGQWIGISAAIGIFLLFVLVPFRRLALNQDGLVLAGLLVAIVGAAVLLGLRFNMKAGFCNSVCPILPVEKLYGQSPLLYVRNPRCVPCSLCTKRGCYELGPAEALSGASKGADSRRWPMSVNGLFVVAFPGFVYGYFQTSDVQLSEWASVYATTLTPALVSMIGFGAIVMLLGVSRRIAVPVLGALAVGVYYWYAGPASADAFSLSVETGLALRWMFLALVAAWLTVALRRSTSQPAPGHPVPARRVEPAELPSIH